VPGPKVQSAAEAGRYAGMTGYDEVDQ
jgi:hypothetical protein